jgi:hypothetical protein
MTAITPLPSGPLATDTIAAYQTKARQLFAAMNTFSIQVNEALQILQQANPSLTFAVQTMAGDMTAARWQTYVIKSAGTLSCPPAPAVGDWLRYRNRSGLTTPVLAGNGHLIEGASTFPLTNKHARGLIVFVGDADGGWMHF